MGRQVIWLEIAGYPNSLISSAGEIHSKYTNKLRKQQNNFKGYPTVRLTYGGNSRTLMVHRVVAQTFLDNPLNLPQVNHRDSDRTNNTIDNLEWISISDNLKHSYREGNRCVKGDANANSKLSSVDVLAIRSSYQLGETVKSIKDKYPVTLGAIYHIIRRKTWQNI
jgi:hypothetical protein